MAKNKAQPKGADLPSNKAIAYQEEMNELMDTKTRNLDELAVYDELMSGVLLAIRGDIKQGLTAEEIMEKYSHLAAARIATIALTDADSSRALSAAKDMLDRSIGKPKEKKEITHKLDRVDEKQLDAILLTEIEALEIDYEEVKDEDSSDV